MNPAETKETSVGEPKKRGRPAGTKSPGGSCRAPRPPETASVLAGRASIEARRRGVAVLSVLSGELTPKQAGETLGITLSRYYALEVDAFGGFLRALEPKPQGYQRSPEREVERLEKENARLARDAERLKTLLRTSQRMVGMLSAVPKAKEGGKEDGKESKKGRKPKKAFQRAMRLKEHLQSPPAALAPSAQAPPAPASPPTPHPSQSPLAPGGAHA